MAPWQEAIDGRCRVGSGPGSSSPPLTRPCGDNSIPILALVGAEILSLMAFVGVCETRAKDVALCDRRCGSVDRHVLHGLRPHRVQGQGGPSPGAGGPDGGIPASTVLHLPPRNRLGQFRCSTSDDDGVDALAA